MERYHYNFYYIEFIPQKTQTVFFLFFNKETYSELYEIKLTHILSIFAKKN